MVDAIQVLDAIDEIADPNGWASSEQLAAHLGCSKLAAATAGRWAVTYGWAEARYQEVGNARWGLTDVGAEAIATAPYETPDPTT